MLVALAVLVVPRVLDDSLSFIDERGTPKGAVVAGAGLGRVDSPECRTEFFSRSEARTKHAYTECKPVNLGIGIT